MNEAHFYLFFLKSPEPIPRLLFTWFMEIPFPTFLLQLCSPQTHLTSTRPASCLYSRISHGYFIAKILVCIDASSSSQIHNCRHLQCSPFLSFSPPVTTWDPVLIPWPRWTHPSGLGTSARSTMLPGICPSFWPTCQGSISSSKYLCPRKPRQSC